MQAKFILSKSKAIQQYNKIKDLGIVSYSFKTNPEVGLILKDSTNIEFNIHSLKGLEILDCPERIWYLASSWDKKEAEKVISKGVKKFVIENEHDLKVLDSTLKQKKIKITLLFRIKIKENTIFTGKYFVYGFDTNTAKKLIREYKNKNYINKIGIHFHRKTENVSEWRIKDELEDSINLSEVDIVNIGGGLPIKYKNIKNFNIDEILNKIRELKNWLSKEKIQLILEPGRFIAGPAIKLVAKIINKDEKNLTINCSLYNSSPDTLFYSMRLLVENEIEDNKKGKEFLIKGNTPDSLDIFRYKVRFEKEPKIGDQIVFLNAGAYNFHTNFFFLPKIKTEIIE